jgi:single-stranded DNA-binding protein
MNEPTITLTGNLTTDPDLRFTPVSRGFVISEALVGGN